MKVTSLSPVLNYTLRPKLFQNIQLNCPEFANLTPRQKFLYLMSQENTEITKLMATNIRAWMKQRNDDLSGPAGA